MSDSGGTDDLLNLIDDLVGRARAKGADAADAVVVESTSLSASFRLGKLEDVERSEARDLGLRCMVGRRQAVVSSTDVSPALFDTLVERAIAMAKAAPEDPYCGFAPAALLETAPPDLDLLDPVEPSAESLSAQAEAAEKAALAVDGVTNSEGAGAGWGRGRIALATSEGFRGTYSSSSHSVSCSVIAGEGTAMERDYDFASARHGGDLADAAEIGRRAGEQAVSRLGARKVKSQAVPVVYAPRVSRSIAGHFAGAVNGVSVARKTSFLRERMGQQIFPRGINIIDDPRRVRGLASKPFDGEGVRNNRLDLVADGVLNHWLMDTATARQLGLETTGRASRGTSSPPSPGATNLYIDNGEISPDDLIADIREGFYVTELIGMGVNMVTGDYSRGAAGFWIENGKIAYPVSEITIAGNLVDMFAKLTPANDLEFRYGSNAPTLRIEGMTIAGA